MRFHAFRFVALAAVVLTAAACGKKEEETVAPAAKTTFPQAGSVNMSAAGGKSTTLNADTSKCESLSTDKIGMAAIALGAACHVGEFVEQLTTGTDMDINNDNIIDCTDFDAKGAKEAGMLLTLLCEPNIKAQPGIVSFADGTGTDYFGISFADWGSNGAAGQWTATSPSYPSNIRMYGGGGGFVAMNLKTATSGTIYMNAAGLPEMAADAGSGGWKGKIDVDFTADQGTNCATTPNSTNCVSMEIQSSNTSDGANGPPSAFHLKVLAGGLSARDAQPEFMLTELYMNWSDAKAAATFNESDASNPMYSLRGLYTQTIVDTVKNQTWVKVSFLDGNGAAITHSYFNSLNAGQCQGLGSSTAATCAITVANYTSAFAGETVFEKTSKTYDPGVAAIFGTAPAAGLVTK